MLRASAWVGGKSAGVQSCGFWPARSRARCWALCHSSPYQKPLVVRCIGGAILVFVTLTFFKLLRLRPGRTLLVAGGGVVGFLSGLVGSAGPLGWRFS